MRGTNVQNACYQRCEHSGDPEGNVKRGTGKRAARDATNARNHRRIRATFRGPAYVSVHVSKRAQRGGGPRGDAPRPQNHGIFPLPSFDWVVTTGNIPSPLTRLGRYDG
eukprot:570181-Prorocentrum_minimum.AAC.1